MTSHNQDYWRRHVETTLEDCGFVAFVEMTTDAENQIIAVVCLDGKTASARADSMCEAIESAKRQGIPLMQELESRLYLDD